MITLSVSSSCKYRTLRASLLSAPFLYREFTHDKINRLYSYNFFESEYGVSHSLIINYIKTTVLNIGLDICTGGVVPVGAKVVGFSKNYDPKSWEAGLVHYYYILT